MKDSNRICANCVTDPYLRKEIGRSETIDEQCDYCEEIGGPAPAKTGHEVTLKL
ncbi:hypothetical protein QZM25_33245 [Burkholderia contaminans]|uniref:hypothetical protein n=1 Tax=Burkholderia cepacia complex TaxID=87882 RepID=UPI001CF1AD61|nr:MULTISPECIES: hypothetical protein [Burkholderia cepacia complex]MCA7890113.1 hypothetical protein [Burkholderia contaminans]MDN7577484.1 hypothetical protein [Burkholderia contaminans]MDN7670919.1 hypothetical protein [Burkholderia vietnamiensis]